MNMGICELVHQINSLYEVHNMKQNFRKKIVVTGKTPLFVIGLFCTTHFICFNIAVLYGNVVLTILPLSTKKTEVISVS